MKLRQKVLAWTSILVIMSSSVLVSSASAQSEPSINYDLLPKSGMFAPTSGSLLKPLANNEGYCASDIPLNPNNQYTGWRAGFSDVSRHAAYCFAIRYLNQNWAITGYADGTFRPNNGVTRGQFSKIAAETFGFTYTCPYGPCPQHFSDVPYGSPFYPYVEAAYNQNWLSGYGDPQCANSGYSVPCFLPNQPVTRGQITKINANAAGYTDAIPSGRQTFSDIPTTDTYYVFVERLQMHGALEEIPLDDPARPTTCGTPGTQPCYHPGYNTTRSDAAQLTFLARNSSLAWFNPDPLYQPRGQAFPRRLTEVNGAGGHDGVQAFVRTPSSNPTGDGFIAGPLGVADGTNLHFIESGPDRRCIYGSDSGPGDGADSIDSCLNHPYASSGTVTMCWGEDPNTHVWVWDFCRDPAFINMNFYLGTNSSYEYRSYNVAGTTQWKADYYD